MKFKPTEKAGGVVIELAHEETRLPAAEPAGALPVFKLQRILVPVDFSDCSKKALAYAIPFAEQFQAELTLLYVLTPYVALPEMGPVDVESLTDARKELEALSQTIPEPVGRSTEVRMGVPHAEIIQAAKDRGIDLIILSTHGRSGLERVLLGSTAEKVVRHAPCPVLVVRQREHEFLSESITGRKGVAA